MSNQPSSNDKDISISKISSSEEAKDKASPRPTIQKNSRRPKSHSSFRSKSEKLIFDFSNENIVNNTSKDLSKGTISNKNFINVNDLVAKNENQNKNNSFGQGDILNSDKNNGFSPNIFHQSKDLNNASGNNIHLGQQILGKLDELINKSSEANEAIKIAAEEMKNATMEMKNATTEMKNATKEMKESNVHQKNMLDLLMQLVNRLPMPQSEDGKNNTNK